MMRFIEISKTTVLPAVLVLSLAMPATAQDDEGEMRDGLDLLGQGSRMILEGLMNEMRPMLEDMQPFFEQEVMPMLQRLGDLVDDLSLYELPEVLPNGDIIIRRSPDAPPYEAQPEIGEGGEVEL